MELLLISLEDTRKKLYEGYFQNDIETIKTVNEDLKNLLYNKILKSIQKTKGKESLVLYYAGETARLIYLTTIPVIGLRLDPFVKKN